MFPVRRFKVVERSMEPTLKTGDYVLARQYLFETPKEGDVIICRQGKGRKNFVKRIIKQENGKYLVRGDNPRSAEFGVTRKGIVGKVFAW